MSIVKDAVLHVAQVNVFFGLSVQTDPYMSANVSEWLQWNNVKV